MPQTEHQQTERIVCERFVCPTRGFHGPHHPVEGPHFTWVRCAGCQILVTWNVRTNPVIPGKPRCMQCSALHDPVARPDPVWVRCFGCLRVFSWDTDTRPWMPARPACDQCNAPEPLWGRGLRDSFRHEPASKERDVLDERSYGFEDDKLRAEAAPAPMRKPFSVIEADVRRQASKATPRLQALAIQRAAFGAARALLGAFQ